MKVIEQVRPGDGIEPTVQGPHSSPLFQCFLNFHHLHTTYLCVMPDAICAVIYIIFFSSFTSYSFQIKLFLRECYVSMMNTLRLFNH